MQRRAGAPGVRFFHSILLLKALATMAARKYSAILYLAILVALAATWGVYKVVDLQERERSVGSGLARKR